MPDRGVSLGDWWNPVSWLQGAGGVLHGVFNAGDAARNALGGVLTILSEIFRFFTDTGHVIRDGVAWLLQAMLPPDLQTWLLGTIGAAGPRWDPGSTYQNVFRAVQGLGLALAAAAAAGRVLRACVDHRVPSAHAFADSLPRFLLVVLAVGIPGTEVSPLYATIAFAVNASMTVATALFAVILHASLLRGVSPGQGWFTQLFIEISNLGRSAVAVVVGGIPMLILLLYAVFLMVVRTIILGFCIATAPLCAATAVFDSGNRFFQWWLDLFVGALMTPIVFALAISLSITVASGVVSTVVVGPILAFVVICGGLWFAAKMVHSITWRHFNHGGALAGFAAGVSTVLGPMHRLASAGFLAEALGANRTGDNSAINVMKRIGLASQGLHPASGTSPSLRVEAAADGVDVPSSSPVGETPAIHAALTGAGRVAVAGSERVFSQQAFNAFAHGHARLIGATTRDHPAGTLSPSDRAKLAWERLAPRTQRSFADDYLSLWLGSAPSSPRPSVLAELSPVGDG